jgi:transposase
LCPVSRPWTIWADDVREGSGLQREKGPKEKTASVEKVVREIRRKTRRRFSAEEKVRIVIEGLWGERSIASLCHCEGIVANLYYRWSQNPL